MLLLWTLVATAREDQGLEAMPGGSSAVSVSSNRTFQKWTMRIKLFLPERTEKLKKKIICQGESSDRGVLEFRGAFSLARQKLC